MNTTCSHERPDFYDAPPSLVRRLDRDENLFHVALPIFRSAGPAVFCRVLELEHFPPATRDNDNFHLLTVSFDGLPYAVASIPARCRSLAELVAQEIGWRIADGVPHLVKSPGIVVEFPMHSRRVFTLEPRSGSIEYAGETAREAADAMLLERMKRAEREHYARFDQLDEIWHRGRRWKRMTSVEPPPSAVDLVMMGEHRGKPSTWYTEQQSDHAWRPYPK